MALPTRPLELIGNFAVTSVRTGCVSQSIDSTRPALGCQRSNSVADGAPARQLSNGFTAVIAGYWTNLDDRGGIR